MIKHLVIHQLPNASLSEVSARMAEYLQMRTASNPTEEDHICEKKTTVHLTTGLVSQIAVHNPPLGFTTVDVLPKQLATFSVCFDHIKVDQSHQVVYRLYKPHGRLWKS